MSLFLVLWFLAQVDGQELDPRLLRDEARVAGLDLQAARSGRYYLVVSLPESTLTLKLRGIRLESYSFESIQAGARFGIDLRGGELEPLFACRAPARPAPPELRPGEVRPSAADVEAPSDPVTLDCELSLEIVPTSSRGLLRSLRDRFGSSEDTSLRVVVVLDDETAAGLSSSLPEELGVIFRHAGAAP